MKRKGAHYSTMFRKAGMAWGKGDLRKAVAILEAGLRMATEDGDGEIAQVIQRDLERYRRLTATPEE